MRTGRRPTHRWSAVVLTAALASACGSDPAGSPPDPGEASTDPPRPVATAATSNAAGAPRACGFADLLTAIPATSWADRDRPIQFSDLDRATEQRRMVRPPGEPPARDDVVTWMRGLTGGGFDDDGLSATWIPAAVSGWVTDDGGEVAAELGWDVSDVRCALAVRSSDGPLTVVAVDADEDRIDSTVGPRVDGIWSIGEAGTLTDPTPARVSGTPVRMGWRDGLLAVADLDEPIADWLRVPDAPRSTLQDEPAVSSVAIALDAAGASTGMIIPPVPFESQFRRYNNRATDEQVADRLAGPIPEGIDLVGLGLSIRDGAAVATFVYHHPTPEAAAANAPTVAEVFTDGVSMRGAVEYRELFSSVTTVVDDQLVIATVQLSASASEVWSLFESRDTFTARREP